MKRHFPNRNHWRAFCLCRFGVMLLFSALPVQGALFQRPQITRAAPELPQPPKNAMLTMRVDEERISAVIADTSLQTVLGELAARTGTIFEVRSHENPLVSVRLDRVSLQEAIQRIAPGSNAIYFYGQNQAAPQRIALVRLFRASTLLRNPASCTWARARLPRGMTRRIRPSRR